MMRTWQVFISVVSASVAIISGCQVKRQLTDSERIFFGKAKISQAAIQDLNDGFFVVTNHTRPADWERTEGPAMIASVDFDSVPLEFFWAYRTPAIRHCSLRGRYPDNGEVYGPFSKKFRCINYEEWAVSYLIDAGTFHCRYITQIEHPCSGRYESRRWEYTSEQCSTYSKIFNTQPNQSISCSDVSRKIGDVRIQNPQPSPVALQANVESAKRKCEELGFQVESERFGECVLRLTK